MRGDKKGKSDSWNEVNVTSQRLDDINMGRCATAQHVMICSVFVVRPCSSNTVFKRI